MAQAIMNGISKQDLTKWMDLVREMIQWSEQEITYLLNNWETRSTEDLAEKLGRSTNSILGKAEGLGLVEVWRIED